MSLEMQMAVARRIGAGGMTASGFRVAPAAPSLPGPAPTPSLPGPETPAMTGPRLGRPLERIAPGGVGVFGGVSPFRIQREFFGEGER